MLDAVIRDRLAARSGGTGLFRRVLKVTGRTESDVDTCAQPVYGRPRLPQVNVDGNAKCDIASEKPPVFKGAFPKQEKGKRGRPSGLR